MLFAEALTARQYARRCDQEGSSAIHNPRNRECGCHPDCWCRRTAVGRAIKWWSPARFIGLHHKSSATAEWKRQRARRSEI